MNAIHSLTTHMLPPQQFTYPFCYEPHPLCVAAAREVQRHIEESGVWQGESGGGKMFGVLVVESGGSLAFLAAYSGLLAGRNDWPYFVPPVFDAQQPDGHFKQTEREISALNGEIDRLRQSASLASQRALYDDARQSALASIESMRRKVADAKARRDALRRDAEAGRIVFTAAERNAMVGESQRMKADLRRLRQQCESRLADLRQPIERAEAQIEELKQRRHSMSDALQLWLFRQYRVLNALGEVRDLVDIFADTVNAVPPAGAGDCCAPKLLQYAYSHALRPVCMAEFWWGESPRREIRHHLHYYPACRSKCLPILTHMLRGLDVEPNPLAQPRAQGEPRIIYEDDSIVVVDKPAGMLSVPGKDAALPDVESYIKEHQELLGNCNVQAGTKSLQQLKTQDSKFKTLKAVHRLDMDTSGLLLLARTDSAYRELQRQFASRETRKRYEAVLDGVPGGVSGSGTISLPLRADITDRPRQCVDREEGKPAVTLYRILRSADSRTLVSLSPHTGRTHQLRLHCAHADGLGCPILGDPLYGRGTAASRMFLHATELEFTHPVTGERLRFESPSGF